MNFFKLLMILFITSSIYGQVKIGDNSNTIDTSSLLELKSSTKTFVLTRISTTEMNAITPLTGALVYNTDKKCIYQYNGIWENLCNSGADNQSLSFDKTTNILSLEDGGAVDLSVYINTDNQAISINGNFLTLEDGGTIDLSAFLDNTDNQNITDFSLTGTILTLTLENGNTQTVDISSTQHQGTTGSVFFAGINGKPTENNNNLFWDNTSYRFGIGTTNPSGKLDITNGSYNELYFSGIGNTNIVSQGDISIVSTQAPSGYIRLNTEGGNTNDFVVRNGKVGVGTIVPLSTFHVKGESYFDGNVGIGLLHSNEKLHIEGNLRLNGSFLDKDGDKGAAGQILSSTLTGTDWVNASSNGSWTINGNHQYSAVSGNVGIGTNSPNYRLDIKEKSTVAGIGTQEAVNVLSTVAANATNNFGVYANSSPTSTGTVTNNYSIFGDAGIPAGSTTSSTYGVYGRSFIKGTTTHAYGVYGIASVLNGGNATNSIRGGQFYARARPGSSTINAYGTVSYAQHEGTVTGSNVASYAVARPLSGATVKSNFSAYNQASIPVGGLVTYNNIGTYSITEVFGSVQGSNFGTYTLSRLRGGTISKTNYGVFAHTGHINGTLNGINYGIYSFSPGDATSSVGTNYAGYFNADHRGNVNHDNYGIYSIARTANGGTIGGSNYAGYFHATPINTNGSGFGTISGNNYGIRIVMGSDGVSGSTYGIYQSGDADTKNYFQNTVGINTTVGAGVLNVNGVATKTGGGVWAVFSDLRSKENIRNYTKGLNELLQLRPVSFKYKKSFGFGSKTHVGFIAQEVEKIIPSMVTESDMHGIKDFKQVDANEVTFMLINAVKELKAENKSLKKHLEKLEKALINLQKK